MTSALPAKVSGWSVAGSIARDDGESGRAMCTEVTWSGFGSESVGEMHAQSCAADGEMKDLAHGGVAEIVRRERVLRLGDLLRRSPTGDPDLRVGCGSMAGLQQEARENDCHSEGESENR